MTKTIAVDFDGVIHAYSRGWDDGSIYDPPLPGAIEALRKLMADGYAVFVHTTREPWPVANWLRVHGIMSVTPGEVIGAGHFWNDTTRVLVTYKKLPAIAYIDDRAIRFINWSQALADLQRHEGAA